MSAGSTRWPGGGGDPQELLGRLGQVGDPAEQHVAEGRGQLRPAVVAGRGEQLLGEEGVSARSSWIDVDQAGVEVVAGDRFELGGRFASVEGRELDRSTRPVRSSSARNGRRGCRRWSSSER